MATYTVRSHPELNELAEYDKDKLIEVINQYKTWYRRNVNDNHRQDPNQDLCFYAMYHIKDFLDENMVEELTTLEDTKGLEGEAYSVWPVSALLREVDNIRKALTRTPVHPALKTMQTKLLMNILNKLELCIRRVIQNTSIRRLHKKSWAHADALAGNHGVYALGFTHAGENEPVRKLSHLPASTSTLPACAPLKIAPSSAALPATSSTTNAPGPAFASAPSAPYHPNAVDVSSQTPMGSPATRDDSSVRCRYVRAPAATVGRIHAVPSGRL